MSTTEIKQGTFAGKTADEWEAKAKESHERRVASIDSCDTDGYLSQWALEKLEAQYLNCARVARDGGTITIEAPVLLATGEVVKGEWVSGEFGMSYMAWEPVGDQRWFQPSRATSVARRRANDAKKGIEMHEFRVPAGLSGRSLVQPLDGEWQDLGHTYSADNA